jgi:hypothetical protein
MYGICMETSVHQISDWSFEFVWIHLCRRYKTVVLCLNSDIYTPDIRMMCGESMGHICTQVRLMCGVCMETSVHKMSDWCVESVWTQHYTKCLNDMWRLYIYICILDIRLMCGICMDTCLHKLSDWCVECVWRYLYASYQNDVWSLYGHICTQGIELICWVCMEIFVH